jgi:hypothetical protein
MENRLAWQLIGRQDQKRYKQMRAEPKSLVDSSGQRVCKNGMSLVDFMNKKWACRENFTATIYSAQFFY